MLLALFGDRSLTLVRAVRCLAGSCGETYVDYGKSTRQQTAGSKAEKQDLEGYEYEPFKCILVIKLRIRVYRYYYTDLYTSVAS